MADTLINKFSTEASANTDETITDALGSSEVLTVLSISFCNTHASTDTTFDLRIDVSGGTDGFIYLNQSLPAKSTFIHNSKIVLKQNDTLVFQTSAAVTCNMVVSALKQTAVATSSGSDYLDRVILHDTSGSAAPITPDNVTDIKTVLAFTVCNKDVNTATTFDVSVRNSGGTAFKIYEDQAIPAAATFEHSDKIILVANEELVFDQAASVEMDVVCSMLRQVP